MRHRYRERHLLEIKALNQKPAICATGNYFWKEELSFSGVVESSRQKTRSVHRQILQFSGLVKERSTCLAIDGKFARPMLLLEEAVE